MDIAGGETTPRYIESLEDPLRLIRQFMSALELDYSDELSAELSDKRIFNRLNELQGLFNGINQATQVVTEIAQAREALLSDKMRSLKMPKSDTPDRPRTDFTYEVLRAIQERFGLYDPNNPNDVTDQFNPQGDLRIALTENLQFQLGSDTPSSGTPVLPPPRTGLSSTQPVPDDYGRGPNRVISSAEAIVREFGNREDPKKDRTSEDSKNPDDKGTRFRR